MAYITFRGRSSSCTACGGIRDGEGACEAVLVGGVIRLRRLSGAKLGLGRCVHPRGRPTATQDDDCTSRGYRPSVRRSPCRRWGR